MNRGCKMVLNGIKYKRMNTFGFLSIIILSIAFAHFSKADMVEVSGVKFENSYSIEGEKLQLVGAGLLHIGFFFRAYVSAFYMLPGVSSDQWHADTPKCLTIHYFWEIPKEEFGQAGREVLARMYPEEELAKIQAQLKIIDSSYVDIKEGDRYSLDYFPGLGTRLLHNDKPIVTVSGYEFARYYFAIWLGPDPIDNELRDKLLGAIEHL